MRANPSNTVAAIDGRQLLPYDLARTLIQSGDVLLCRPGQWLVSRLIARGSDSLYCHAAMAAWWRGSLMCLEMLQYTGGRAVSLSSQVRAWPGRWDVYRLVRVGDDFDPHAAVDAMIRMTGTPYGWSTLLRTSMRRLPIARWMLPPPAEDRDDFAGADESTPDRLPHRDVIETLQADRYREIQRLRKMSSTEPLHCSGAISRACRIAGVDLVPNLPDWATTPGDLARSALLEYRFTLDCVGQARQPAQNR